MSDWGMTPRQAQELDNHITGHWGEDSVAPDSGVLGNLYDAARLLLAALDIETVELEATKAAISNLRDALAEVEA